MIGVLLAVPELDQEPALVAGAGGHGLRVARRCVDAVDLLAAATADPAAAVIVSPGLPRCSADVVARVGAPADRVLVGLAEDEAGLALLRLWGVTSVVAVGPTAAATLSAVSAAVARAPEPVGATGVWPTGCWEPSDADDAAGDAPVMGQLVAVWGPIGSPGRTTVAIGVAEALSEAGLRTCVADADTYAPSMAMALGILDDPGGLPLACRHADNGSLADATLLGASRRIRGGLHTLTGLSGASGWADLRTSALDRVWDRSRSVFDVTVVDVGFCVEDDEGSVPLGRRRNAAAITALTVADHVLAVADASAAGAARLVTGWPLVERLVTPAAVTIVRNRSEGRDRAWEEAVRSGGVAHPVRSVPTDARALAACWRRGRSLGEGARRSRIRRALGALAGSVVPP